MQELLNGAFGDELWHDYRKEDTWVALLQRFYILIEDLQETVIGAWQDLKLHIRTPPLQVLFHALRLFRVNSNMNDVDFWADALGIANRF